MQFVFSSVGTSKCFDSEILPFTRCTRTVCNDFTDCQDGWKAEFRSLDLNFNGPNCVDGECVIAAGIPATAELCLPAGTALRQPLLSEF